MYVKGTMESGGVITNETPAAEWDDTTTASITYLRYEVIDNDTVQYIERIDESISPTSKREVTRDTWNNRVTATYKPIN